VPIKDIVGKTTEELFPKGQAEKMRKDDREVIISGKPKRDIIQPYDTPDEVRWAITDKMPYKDKEGKVIGVISLSKDITVQRKSEQELKQTYQSLKKTMDATIQTVSKMIEAKDPYTAGHQQRVSQLTTAIAKGLNLSRDKIEGIRVASLIHDIGKISVPTEILSKSITLSDMEFNLIKGHSQIGYDILKSIDFSYPVAQIVLQHHERLNGSGYPNKLKDDEILLEARIIGVADVVEAMSSHRPYRPAFGIDKALEEISQNKCTLYDPVIVDTCLRIFKEKEFKFK
jgi:putative nucleotidyltransferase with HDIG domain